MVRSLYQIKLTIEQIPNTYLIADTHFDHKNIIRYCHRPFPDVKAMNSIILQNWQHTVRSDSLVFFLGDMSYGRGARPSSWWLRKLPGRIIYIRGNHEIGKPRGNNVVAMAYKIILDANGEQFYLTHDPANIPSDWDGWGIHGHKHNTVPFIDYRKKRVCVSVEAINYRPLNLASLLSLRG